jgi:hypothetical protein
MVTEENIGRHRRPGRCRIEMVRRWLKLNKVFFETIAATCLAAAAIIVAGVQADIAAHQGRISEKQNTLIDKQNGLVDIQARITEAQAMPTFDIKIVQELNQATGRADEYILTMDNSGGPIHELDSRAVYIVNISSASPGPPIKEASLQYYVDDYYAARAMTALSKGHLVTFLGHNNNLGFVTFSAALRSAAKLNGWLYANTEENTFLHIEYKDILNRVHVEYYQVEPVLGSRSLSNDEGVQIFRAAAKLRRLHLSDLTVDTIAPSIQKEFGTSN